MKATLFASLFAVASASPVFAAPAAPAGAPAGGSALGAFFPLIIFVVIFYFFILRPQKKRQKTHDNLVNSLTRGDKVITAGGFFGIIRDVKEDSVIIEIAEGVPARVLKGSISSKINVETPKPAPKAEESKAKVEEPKAKVVEPKPKAEENKVQDEEPKLAETPEAGEKAEEK